jgi:biopolymer transport protein ExbD
MAVNIPVGGDEDEVKSDINTTPLVDVMLVLLIIFLITIPAIVTQIPLQVPVATDKPTQTKPQDVRIAIQSNGQIYWNLEKVTDNNDLLQRLQKVAVQTPQPEIHIRADKETRFEYIGKVILDCQLSAIQKLAFTTEPESAASG